MDGPILVAGAGALGSVFGAMLRTHGYEVTMLGRRAHLDAIARDGLRVSGLFGERVARGFALAGDSASLAGRFPLILLTVKSYDTATMAAALADRLTDDGLIVSLQNGLGNIEELSAQFGVERVLGARVIFGAEVPAPGSVRVTVFADPVAIGPAPGPQKLGAKAAAGLHERAKSVAALLDSASVPAHAVADVMPTIWTKLLYNAALNPLGALLKVHYGALGEDAGLRRIMDRTIDEAFAVAWRSGVALPFADAGEYRALFYERLLPTTFHHRPTMLYDLEYRGRTEIGALNGKIVELADRLGLEAEMNRTLVALIRARERLWQGAG